jgi:hypothetical protein
MNNPREKKYEEVCRVTSRDFCIRWIGSSEDVLLPEPRAFPYLLRGFGQTKLRVPPRGRCLRPSSSALSVGMVLPHLRRRVPAVSKVLAPTHCLIGRVGGRAGGPFTISAPHCAHFSSAGTWRVRITTASTPGRIVRASLLRRRERGAEHSKVLSRLGVFDFFLRGGDLAHDFCPVLGENIGNPDIGRVTDRGAEHARVGGL